MTRSKGRLGSYALWQLRDYMTGPFIWTVMVTLALGVMPMLVMHAQMEQSPDRARAMGMVSERLTGQVFAILGALGALLAVARLVSADRQPGLSRFLFSKPVNVSLYYAQAWIVRGVGLVLLALVTGLLLNQFVMPVPYLAATGYIAVCWLLIGGVGILISVLTAQDAGVLIAVYLLPDLLGGLHSAYPTWGWVNPVLTVMPPMQKLEPLRTSLLSHTAVAQGDLWHMLLYGAGTLALSLYLVRRLPLVR